MTCTTFGTFQSAAVKPSDTGVAAPSLGSSVATATVTGASGWLAKRTGQREADIVLFGESLGGGVMVDLAAADGARALVLENTFTSLPDVAAWHYPWLPVRLLQYLLGAVLLVASAKLILT